MAATGLDNYAPVAQHLREWRATAEIHADPRLASAPARRHHSGRRSSRAAAGVKNRAEAEGTGSAAACIRRVGLPIRDQRRS